MAAADFDGLGRPPVGKVGRGSRLFRRKSEYVNLTPGATWLNQSMPVVQKRGHR
jgi:hypothetical protein